TNLVHLILPRDPELRARWRKLSKPEKLAHMAEKGYQFDQNFTYKKYFIFTSEFFADVQQFPFLSSELHDEGSGNWEIKSSIQGFRRIADLAKAVEALSKIVPKDDFRLHVHNFFPASMMPALDGTEAELFVDFLERLSFYMLLSG